MSRSVSVSVPDQRFVINEKFIPSRRPLCRRENAIADQRQLPRRWPDGTRFSACRRALRPSTRQSQPDSASGPKRAPLRHPSATRYLHRLQARCHFFRQLVPSPDRLHYNSRKERGSQDRRAPTGPRWNARRLAINETWGRRGSHREAALGFPHSTAPPHHATCRFARFLSSVDPTSDSARHRTKPRVRQIPDRKAGRWLAQFQQRKAPQNYSATVRHTSSVKGAALFRARNYLRLGVNPQPITRFNEAALADACEGGAVGAALYVPASRQIYWRSNEFVGFGRRAETFNRTGDPIRTSASARERKSYASALPQQSVVISNEPALGLLRFGLGIVLRQSTQET